MSTRTRARGIALAAVAVALLSALFFTCTYVLNRAAATGGGHWAWTASLRYLITLPIMLLVMPWQGGIAPVWRAIRAHPGPWLLCSGIGFVLFYLLLGFAAASGPSWLIAGTFQLTVIAGMLWRPFLYRRRPRPDSVASAGGRKCRGERRAADADRSQRRSSRPRCLARADRGGDQRVRVSARQSQPAAASGARGHRAQRHPARVRHDVGEPAAVVGGGGLCVQRPRRATGGQVLSRRPAWRWARA